MNLFDPSYLCASLFWGSVGLAYIVYGKRQQSFMPFIAGIVMIGVSYFVGSALLMSLICIVLAAAVYGLLKRGY